MTLHHFDDDAAVALVRELARSARSLVLIDDWGGARRTSPVRVFALTLWRTNRLHATTAALGAALLHRPRAPRRRTQGGSCRPRGPPPLPVASRPRGATVNAPDVLVVGGGPREAPWRACWRRGDRAYRWSTGPASRPKPCGDYLDPGAVAALVRLALLDQVEPLDPARLDGWRLRSAGSISPRRSAVTPIAWGLPGRPGRGDMDPRAPQSLQPSSRAGSRASTWSRSARRPRAATAPGLRHSPHGFGRGKRARSTGLGAAIPASPAGPPRCFPPGRLPPPGRRGRSRSPLQDQTPREVAAHHGVDPDPPCVPRRGARGR